jgi:hypothetical protein
LPSEKLPLTNLAAQSNIDKGFALTMKGCSYIVHQAGARLLNGDVTSIWGVIVMMKTGSNFWSCIRRGMMPVAMIFAATLVGGCGPRYFLPATGERPALFVASAYSREGCLELLRQDAAKLGFEIKLSGVAQESVLFPFYKGVRCTGEVVGRVTPR